MLLRKFIVYSLSFIVLILFNAYPAFAQSASSSSTLPPTVSPVSPLYTDLLIHNLFHSFSCLAIGQSVIGQPCLTYQMTQNAQGMIQSVPVLSQVNLSGGTLGAVTGVIGALYQNPPVRTADYLASLSESFGVVREANAQVVGSGEQVLNPILKLWQVSRNISYVLMIIIFLVIGLMVMFRNKINPQTVISAQAALPGLVIGLIMITFSYFFAGLISDMAFVGTNVVGYYFSAAQNKPAQNLVEDATNQNAISIFAPLTGILSQANVSEALDQIWPSLERKNRQELNPLDFDPSRVITAIAAMMMTQLVMPFGSMFGPIGQAIAGIVTFTAVAAKPTAIAGFALSFIGMLILIYAMIRLLLRLINNYITIIFLTISAPFQLLAAALPGRQGLATNWILNMLANILAFPAVFAVLYFVAFILGPNFINEYYPGCKSTPQQNCVFRSITQLDQTNTGNFARDAYAAADQISIVNPHYALPLFGGLNLGFVNLLLAFGALVALPSIPDIINRTIGRMSQAGQLIGQEMGGSFGQGQRYAGQFQQGVGGIAGQVGNLRDQPGYLLQGGKWIKVTGKTPNLNEQQIFQSGYRPGQWTRTKSAVGGFLGGIRRRGGGGPPEPPVA